MEQVAARTEADFTTETFTIKSIDHIKETKNGQKINDYFVLSLEEESFSLGFR
jgi:hypothetical protein